MAATTAALLGPIIGAALSGGAMLAAPHLAPKPKGPPDISDERKKTLGSFAARMAAEEDQYRKARDNNSLLLRPGGKPISYSTLRRPNEPMTY